MFKQCVEGINYKRKSLRKKNGFDLEREFEKNYHLMERHHTWHTPSILVNGQILQGRLTEVDILNEICQSLIIKPNECNNIGNLLKKNSRSPRAELGLLVALKIVFLALLTACFSVIAFYVLYKIKLRREFEWRRDQEVDSALANYYMENRMEMGVGTKVSTKDEDEEGEGGLD